MSITKAQLKARAKNLANTHNIIIGIGETNKMLDGGPKTGYIVNTATGQSHVMSASECHTYLLGMSAALEAVRSATCAHSYAHKYGCGCVNCGDCDTFTGSELCALSFPRYEEL